MSAETRRRAAENAFQRAREAGHAVEQDEHFHAWTQSEQFRAAHAKAGENRGKVEYLSGPHFEGFEVIIHEDSKGVRRADAA